MTQKLDKGGDVETANSVAFNRFDSSNLELWRDRLLNVLKLSTLPPDELQQLKGFLVDHHDIFSSEEFDGSV